MNNFQLTLSISVNDIDVTPPHNIYIYCVVCVFEKKLQSKSHENNNIVN